MTTRVGSRSGEPPFDWEDPATWAPALEGVGSVYMSYFPDLAIPGAPEAVTAFAEVALERGARRLVLLSGRGEEEAQRAERAVAETGAEVTIVRCAWFMQNFSEDYMLGAGPRRRGRPARRRCAGAVRRRGRHRRRGGGGAHRGRAAGELYELTSPRLLTLEEVVGEIAAATGREIRYVPISVEEYAAGAAGHGVSAEYVGFLTYVFSEVFGRNAYVTDGVQRALGREPRDFRDYARATAATGIWNPSGGAGR